MSVLNEFSDDVLFNQIRNKFEPNTNIAILKLTLDPEIITNDMKNLYKFHIDQHNKQIVENRTPNSGFDLLIPTDYLFKNTLINEFIDHGVKCQMLQYDLQQRFVPSAFHLVPRSSFSKTPLIMSNHIGIIDSGYRGNILAAVKYCPPPSNVANCVSNYPVESKTRLFQLCHPSLCPIYVVLVNNDQLGSTDRGTGGFGSTGV